MAKARKVKYEPPTASFPYKLKWRLMMLSKPRKYIVQTNEGMPEFTVYGVRTSALRGVANDRVTDLNYPYNRKKTSKHKLASSSKTSLTAKKGKPQPTPAPKKRLLLRTKRRYKGFFPNRRVEYLDRYIELSNVTCYAKLANCVLDLKKNDTKDQKKKRGWSDSDWKKHMDYISGIAAPRRVWEPDPVERGPTKAIGEFNFETLAALPDHKLYKRISEEEWYKDPIKVSPTALKYVISERVLKLAAPKVLPNPD